MYARVTLGATVDLYYKSEGEKKVISKDTFDDVIKLYFDDFVLNEVKNRILF